MVKHWCISLISKKFDFHVNNYYTITLYQELILFLGIKNCYLDITKNVHWYKLFFIYNKVFKFYINLYCILMISVISILILRTLSICSNIFNILTLFLTKIFVYSLVSNYNINIWYLKCLNNFKYHWGISNDLRKTFYNMESFGNYSIFYNCDRNNNCCY
jgi:hypothetical protein